MADVLQPTFVVDSEHQSSEIVSTTASFSQPADYSPLLHSGLDFEPFFRPAPWQMPTSFSFRHDPPPDLVLAPHGRTLFPDLLWLAEPNGSLFGHELL